MSKKCIIAMSGGVDSSVAAFLMKENGYECIGATMIMKILVSIGKRLVVRLMILKMPELLQGVFQCHIMCSILKMNLKKK